MRQPIRRSIRFAAVALAAAALAGCASYELVRSGAPQKVGDMTVTPSGAWATVPPRFHPDQPNLHDDVVVWTADSPILNELIFVPGMADGERLYGEPAQSPPFQAEANVVEVAEYVRSTFAAQARAAATEIRTEPAAFLGGPGALTEFDLPYPDGSPGRVLAAAAIRGGKLYMIAWRGVGELYYGERKAEVERIIRTARLAGGGKTA